jgi:hypothetical protein
MAYKENVIIDIEVEGVGADDLKEISESLTTVKGAVEALEALDGGEFDNIESNLTEVSEAISNIEPPKDPFKDVDKGAQDLVNHSATIQQNMDDIVEALEIDPSFTPQLDEDAISEDFRRQLEADLDARDIRIPITPKPDLKPQDKQTIEKQVANVTQRMQEVVDESDETIDLTGAVKIEETKFDDLVDSLDDAIERKRKVTKENKKTAAAAEDTALETDLETRSFGELIKKADTLSEAKDAVAKANRHVQEEAGKSRSDVIRERVEMGELNEESLRLADGLEQSGESFARGGRALRKFRRSTDQATDSIAAAARVSDLFEDGLGTLSLNLGAFTIGLRNFLTQVPMLLIGLGALTVTITAVAAAFITLSAAMASVAGAGLLVHLQEIESSMEGVDSMAEALEIVMKDLRDVFISAVSPLTESGYALEFFERAVNGSAAAVNILAQSFAQLIEGSETIQSFEDAGMAVYTLNDAFDDFGDMIGGEGGSWQKFTNSLSYSFLILGERMVAGLDIFLKAMAKAIKFSTDLYSRIEDLMHFFDRFTDMAAEMAELGIKIGGGLLPIFEGFIEVVETVGEALNRMDGQMAQNLITGLALLAIFDKMAGAMTGLITVIPNMAMSLGRVFDEASSATTAVSRLSLAFAQASTELSGFVKGTNLLPGLFGIRDAVEGTSTRFRRLAYTSDEALEAFDILSKGAGSTSEELKNAAIAGDLFEGQARLTNIKREGFEIPKSGIDKLRETPIDRATVDLDKLGPDVPLLTKVFGGDEEMKKQMGNMDLLENRFSRMVSKLDRVGMRVPGPIFDIQDVRTPPPVELTGMQLFDEDEVRFGAGRRTKLGVRAPLEDFDDFIQTDTSPRLNVFGKDLGPVSRVQDRDERGRLTMGETLAIPRKKTTAKKLGMRKIRAGQMRRIPKAIREESMAGMEFTEFRRPMGPRKPMPRISLGDIAQGFVDDVKELSGMADKALNTVLKGTMNRVGNVGSSLAKLGERGGVTGKASNAILNLGKSFVKTYLKMAPLLATAGALILTTAILGGLFAGLIVHMDGVKKAVSGIYDFLKQLIGIFVDNAIRYFVHTFNYLVDIFEALRFAFGGIISAFSPLIAGLSGTGDEASTTGSILSGVQAILDASFAVFNAVAFVVTRLIDVFATFTRIALIPLEIYLKAVFTVLGFLLKMFREMFAAISSSTAFDSLIAILGKVADSIQFVTQIADKVTGLQLFEDNIGSVSKLEASQEDSLKITRDELGAATDEMKGSVAEKAPKFLNFSTDKSTNIDQEINADPDDETTLSRAVERAIEQAQSAARRRQGL